MSAAEILSAESLVKLAICVYHLLYQSKQESINCLSDIGTLTVNEETIGLAGVKFGE